MRVRRIEAQGFRSFVESIVIDDLGRLNVFVGRNNVGKTNVLEILGFIRHLSRGEGYKPFAEVQSGSSKTVRIDLSFELDPEERKSLIGRLFETGKIRVDEIINSNLLRTVKLELLLSDAGIVRNDVSISNLIDGSLSIWRMTKDLSQVKVEAADLLSASQQLTHPENLNPTWANRGNLGGFVWNPWSNINANHDVVQAFLRDFYSRKIEAIPPVRQSPVRLPTSEARTLNDDGGNLPQVLSTIGMEDSRALVSISDTLRDISGIDAIQPRLRGSEAWPTIKDIAGIFDLSNTSSGIHQATILVTKILTCATEGILLIEEPELHLHAEAQRVLQEFIQENSKRIQFLITTHSTIFANVGAESHLYLVTRRGITSSVRPVREQDELKFVKLELGHNNTDLYEFNVVVFVEGDSEVVGFPIIASTIGLDFVKAGIRIINAKGSGKAKKIEQYLEYLRDSDTIPFVIADGDKEVRKKLADWEGAGILPKGNYRMWDMEFEDLFPIDLVAQCCGELGYRDITLEKLKELQSSGSVVHAIRRILYEAGQRELDKPSLAEAMANKAAEQSRIPKRLEETLQALAKCAQSMNPGLRLSVDWSLSVS